MRTSQPLCVPFAPIRPCAGSCHVCVCVFTVCTEHFPSVMARFGLANTLACVSAFSSRSNCSRTHGRVIGMGLLVGTRRESRDDVRKGSLIAAHRLNGTTLTRYESERERGNSNSLFIVFAI